MKALLAIRENQVLMRTKRILHESGYAYTNVADVAEMVSSISEQKPDVIISEAYVDSEPVFDLVKEHPEQPWILILNLVDSWGVVRYLATLAPRVVSFSPAASIADIVEALKAIEDQDDRFFGHSYLLASGSWITALQLFPGAFGEDPSDANASEHLTQKLVLKARFHADYPASCTSKSVLGAMCRIVRERKSGWLMLRRRDICLRYQFKSGMLVNIDSNSRLFDIYAFAAFKGMISFDELNAIREKQSRDLPDYEVLERQWFASLITEGARWIRGELDFVSESFGNDVVPKLSTEEMNRIFEKAVFEVPCRERLDIMRAALPFRLRLTVRVEEALKLFSTAESKAVVERLKKSDTLSELLVYLPQGYPVHQTIYLLLAQGCLDIE